MKKEILYRVNMSTQYDAFGNDLYNYQVYFAGVSNWSYLMTMSKEAFTYLSNALKESHTLTELKS